MRSELPGRRLALRGADLILLALDAEAADDRRGCNNGVVAMECDGEISADRLRQALSRFIEQCPWPAARLARPFPWGKLTWTVPSGPRPAPPVERRVVPRIDPPTMLALTEEALNDRIDPWRGPVMRLVVVAEEGGKKGGLVWSFSRPLMDPHGADVFLTQLDELDRSPGRSPWAERPLFEPPRDPRPLRVRGPIARRSVEFMRQLSLEPPVSLGPGKGSAGRVRLLRTVFPERAASGVSREAAFRLAVVGRALARVFQERGLRDVPFLVPVSVDMRPKGQRGPTFGNYLTFHFARFRPTDAPDAPALASILRQRMADALRQGVLDAHWTGMDFVQYRRVKGILAEMSWARNGGHAFSFNCADTGEFAPTLDRFLGVGIRSALHAPAVSPCPGVGFFFSRRRGMESVILGFVDGVLTDGEAEALLREVTAGIGGEVSR